MSIGFILSFIIMLLLAGVSGLLIIGFTNVRESITPFECGFDSNLNGQLFFSVNFFFFCLLFLIFDIELLFFLHFPVSFTFQPFIWFLLVLTVVFLGFLYEENSINWIY